MAVRTFVGNRAVEQKDAAWRLYGRRVTGSRRLASVIKYDLITGLFGPWPGGLGVWLRARFYRYILGGMRPSSFVSTNVVIRNPQNVRLGHRAFIDSFVLLEGMSDHEQGGVEIGDGTYIHLHSIISAAYHGFVRIGKNCSVGAGSQIYGAGGVTIGDGVMIAGQTMIIASSHIFDDLDTPMYRQANTARGITVGSDVWLGANVIILDGVTIGAGAVIGAGSVVLHDVEPRAVVAGAPARLLHYRQQTADQAHVNS
jgi:acetyltransferase-like isoleucine patch superfamily enzyme